MSGAFLLFAIVVGALAFGVVCLAYLCDRDGKAGQ
jgi:hypothetical protein